MCLTKTEANNGQTSHRIWRVHDFILISSFLFFKPICCFEALQSLSIESNGVHQHLSTLFFHLFQFEMSQVH